MKDLDLVIGSLGGCLRGICSNCEYGDSDCHRDELLRDALAYLRELYYLRYDTQDRPCDDCVHSEACLSWIRHGEVLYEDFSYSTENCPYWDGQCRSCGWWQRYKRPGSAKGVCNKYAMGKREDGFCDEWKPIE